LSGSSAEPADEHPEKAAGTSSPASHWRRRARGTPIPADQAARQGTITALAFQALGKDAAIAFLNTENANLGGRPIAIATASDAGQATVRAELEKVARKPD
jgi:expansin (peptidoglycan-binding protein)